MEPTLPAEGPARGAEARWGRGMVVMCGAKVEGMEIGGCLRGNFFLATAGLGLWAAGFGLLSVPW